MRRERGQLDGLEPWVRVLELLPAGFPLPPSRARGREHWPSARSRARRLLEPLPRPTTELLDQLAAAYRQARSVTDHTALHRVGEEPPRTCRYCGARCCRGASRAALDGHANCVVTGAFLVQLLDAFASTPTLTTAVVAAQLDLARSTIYGWYRRATEIVAAAERSRRRVA